MWSRFFRTKPKYRDSRGFCCKTYVQKLKRSDNIVVVSGLPRSGTSMMMGMLEAGGLNIVTDHVRRADASNPHGYYEFEQVKKLKEDASFLETAYGKAVKIISLLLYDLPEDKSYKIIFMRRGLEEILSSQNAMLRRQGKHSSLDRDDHMKQIFESHLRELYAWLPRQRNLDTLYVDYHDVIKHPLQHAQRINTFLGNRLDAQRMAQAVDQALYRERASHD